MTTDLAPTRVPWPDSGEAYDLERVEDAAALSHRAGEALRAIRHLKELADDALRTELSAQAQTIISAGEFEVEEETGRASYDCEALYQGLLEAGLDKKVVAGMFEPKLRDARELGKLERRNDAVAKAAEAARSRSRGRVVVRKRKSHTPAPATPAHIRERAAEIGREEADAAARGI